MPHATGNNEMPAATYGWIGLGRMGLPMALHLRRAMSSASKLIICDINSDRIKAFLQAAKSLGPVEVAFSPRETAEKSEIIITSLPPGDPFFQVFTEGPSSILAAGASDGAKIVIDTSTVDVQTSLRVAKKITSSGFGDFVDCPVSGGMIYAEKGTLSAMVGGSNELFNRIHPVLLTFAAEKSIYHCGPPGAGLAAKIINNYVASISYVALCEGMNTGVRFGLDAKVLTDVINASSGMSWNSLHMCPVKGIQSTSSASKDFKGGPDGGPGFDFAAESTEMTVALMDQVNAKSVCAPLMKDIWTRAMKSPLCEGREYRSLYRLFSEEDGRAVDETETW